MPSRKIISVMILCFGVVFSTWLFTRNSSSSKNLVAQKTSNSVSAEPVINIEGERNDDWKKILTNVDPKNKNFINLTNNSRISEDDTTLTDQMSRDFLSQYLLTVKNGTPISPQIAEIIAKNTLSLPDYNQKAPIYIGGNLIITSKTDKNTMLQYKQEINQALKPIYFNLKDDPISITLQVLSTEKTTELKKLDPIIAINKAEIKKLLEMVVPTNAVIQHLELLNASARILFDLESMKLIIDDPVKAFPALQSYPGDVSSFSKSLYNMDLFLKKITL